MPHLRSTAALIALLAPLALIAGCASATRARFQDVSATAASKEQALRAARAALGRNYENVRANRRGTLVVADPLYVDFGQTELDAVAKAIEKPDEVVQAFGRIRRTPSIRIKERGGIYSFEIRVEREVEELESGYIQYDRPYDYNETSSMPTDPTRYGGFKVPPREEWIPQGNDLGYETQLRQALAEELAR